MPTPSSPRWLKLKVALAALVALTTVFIVALMWRPSGATRDGAAPNFLVAVAANGIPVAGAELLANGETTFKLTETAVTDIGASLLDRNTSGVPVPVANAVGRHLPPFVETLCGCSIRREDVTLYVKCHAGLTFYSTVRGTLARTPAGALTFTTTAVKVGLLPVPMMIIRRAAETDNQVIFDPEDAGFSVVSMQPESGAVVLGLATDKGDGREN